MREILDYYLVMFDKPIGQMTIVDLLSLAALPVSFIVAMAVLLSVLGKVIEFFEWEWPDKSKAQRAVMIGAALLIAVLVFGAL